MTRDFFESSFVLQSVLAFLSNMELLLECRKVNSKWYEAVNAPLIWKNRQMLFVLIPPKPCGETKIYLSPRHKITTSMLRFLMHIKKMEWDVFQCFYDSFYRNNLKYAIDVFHNTLNKIEDFKLWIPIIGRKCNFYKNTMVNLNHFQYLKRLSLNMSYRSTPNLSKDHQLKLLAQTKLNCVLEILELGNFNDGSDLFEFLLKWAKENANCLKTVNCIVLVNCDIVKLLSSEFFAYFPTLKSLTIVSKSINCEFEILQTQVQLPPTLTKLTFLNCFRETWLQNIDFTSAPKLDTIHILHNEWAYFDFPQQEQTDVLIELVGIKQILFTYWNDCFFNLFKRWKVTNPNVEILFPQNYYKFQLVYLEKISNIEPIEARCVSKESIDTLSQQLINLKEDLCSAKFVHK